MTARSEMCTSENSGGFRNSGRLLTFIWLWIVLGGTQSFSANDTNTAATCVNPPPCPQCFVTGPSVVCPDTVSTFTIPGTNTPTPPASAAWADSADCGGATNYYYLSGSWTSWSTVSNGAGGSVSKLRVYVQATAGTASLKMEFYSLEGACLGETMVVTPTTAGWAEAPLAASIPITPNTAYQVGISANEGTISVRANNAVNNGGYALSDYASFPLCPLPSDKVIGPQTCVGMYVTPSSDGNFAGTSTSTGTCDGPSVTWTVTGNAAIVGSCNGTSVQVKADHSCGQYTVTANLVCENCPPPGTACSATVMIQDTNPPMITCPPDVSVSCPGWPPATDFAGGQVIDNCDPKPSVLHVCDEYVQNCPTKIKRTYKAIDACGNCATCFQYITLGGNPEVHCPPWSNNCFDRGIPSCATSIAQFESMGGWYDGFCGTNLTLTCSDGTTNGVFYRTYTIADECLSASCVMSFSTQVIPPPVVICPPDLTVDCLDNVPPRPKCIKNFRAAGGQIVPLDYIACFSSTDSRLCGSRCDGKIYRTNTVVDICSNVASCVQIISVRDTTPPTLVCGPDKEVQAGTDWAFDIPTAVDSCSDDVEIEIFCTKTNLASFPCPKLYSVTRTWKASDDCDNFSFCNQTVTIVHTEPPTLVCGRDKEIECGTDWSFDIPTAVDKGDGGPVAVEIVNTVTNWQFPGMILAEFVRTWKAVDSCGNISYCNQTVTEVETLPPVIVCTPDFIAECGIAWDFGYVFAIDICSGQSNTTILTKYTITNAVNPPCPALYTVQRAWKAIDARGFMSVCYQNVTVVDTLPPTITCGADKEVQAGTDWDFDVPTAVDICDGTNVLINVVSTVTNVATPRCPKIYSVTRTWRSTDTCGNASYCNQTVTLVDTEPPNITCGSDKEVQAGTDWAFDIPTAVDKNDLENVLIEVASTVTNVATPRCPRIFSVTRTWKASDTCGNASFCNQTVTLVDTEPPNIICGADKEVECGTDWAFDIPTAVDKNDLNNVLIEVVSTVTNIATPLCPKIFSVTRTWRASDTCGNASFCNQTATIVDTTPPTLVCPQNRTIECGQPLVFSDPSAVDDCDGTNVVLTVLSTVTNTFSPQCPGLFTVVRSWKATDTCGNASFCNQTLTVVDTTPPNITCPDDSVIQAGGAISFSNPSAVDSCSGTNVTLRLVGTVTNILGPCSTVYVRTWEATDPCGNAARCTQTITVVDTVPPVLTCPANQIIECGEPWAFGTPTAVDVFGGTNATIRVVSTTTNLTCGKTFSATRTWSATDNCTNTSFCSQTITIVDTLPPVLTCSPNLIVECGTSWNFSSPNVEDVCDGTNVTVRITSTMTNTSGFCGKTFSASRAWEAIDSCGNRSTCTQTVTVVDTLPPVLTCTANRVVDCASSWSFSPPYAEDVCDGTNVTVRITSTVTNSIGCGKSMSVTRTWEAIDSCGNRSTCTQNITVADTTPPEITCPSDRIVECIMPWTFDTPNAQDLCDGTNVLVRIFSTVTNNITANGKEYTAIRTWEAFDSCSNRATCSQTITVICDRPPVLTCPADRIVECGVPWNFGTPIAFSVCDGTNVSIRLVSTITNFGPCGSLLTAIRTWEVVDSCTNRATCSQTITVVDTMPPVLTCSADRVVECGTPWAFGTPYALDDCNGTNVILRPISTVTNFGACGRQFSATRVWEAIDACTNRSTCSQTITVVDTTPPVLTCGASLIVECGTGWNFTTPNADDVCDGPITPVIVSTITNFTCGKTFSATRTWRATDSCSNAITCSQTITIVDTTPPVLTCMPDRNVECGTPWNFSTPFADDTCDGTNVIVRIVSTVTNLGTGKLLSATRTWEAIDSCTNRSTCSQTITVVDDLPPMLVCGPNLTVECGTPWNFSTPSALDICDITNITVHIVSTVTNLVGPNCPKAYSATRTWEALDTIGNRSTCSQTVTVADITPPELVCPDDRVVECGVPWNFGTPFATDLCDGTITPVIISTVTNPAPNGYSAIRIWRATDSCSNSVTCSQTILVADTRPPALTGAADAVVEACVDPWKFTTPTVYDVCSGTNVTVTIFNTVTNPLNCPNSFAVTRTWKATDAAGNASFLDQTITILDRLPPVITCPADAVVECGLPWSFDDFGTVAANDACDGTNVTIRLLSTVTNNAMHCPNMTVIRTWSATDHCGNAAYCSQVVTVVDRLAPMIACPADAFVECGFPWSFDDFGTVAANDACDGTNVTLRLVSTVTNNAMRCPDMTVIRTWSATDHCGNAAYCSQVITVIDTIPPTMACPPGKTVECGQAFDFDTPVASDICSDASLVIVSTVTNTFGHCPNTFEAIRLWKAIDACSNAAFCSQKVTVVDTRPPVFTIFPADVDLGCNPVQIPNCDVTQVVATDLCSAVTITCTNFDTLRGCKNSRVLVYTASDACGNKTCAVQRITWKVDTTPPVLTCSSNKTVECTQAWGFDPPTAFDNCDGTNVTITILNTVTNAGAAGSGTFLATRTWGAADTCGNTAVCSQTVTILPCPQTGACRVTGGSNHQTNTYQVPNISTPAPTFVSHGGQVGAPFSVGTPWTPNSPCITGEWQHNRHLTGNSLVGTFHASGNGNESDFDSLLCACLPCDEKPHSVGVVGGICDPNDKVCGPQPRRAPANKICFSGVGDYTFTTGKKTVKAVFRVDIEDRGEGNSASSTLPLDRYRIRLWLLDPSTGRTTDPNSAEAMNLRFAASADPATIATLANTEDLKINITPDIDDGGDMTQGNHQIHPATGAQCSALIAQPAASLDVAAQVASLTQAQARKYGIIAHGYQGSHALVFVRQVTITNSGSVTLTNLSVAETSDSLLQTNTALYFAAGAKLLPGGSVTRYDTNILTADTVSAMVVSAKSTADGSSVLASSSGFALVSPATTQPQLSIDSSGGTLTLGWPLETDTDFILETTSSLKAPVTWTVITNASNPLVLPATGGKFYRLRKP